MLMYEDDQVSVKTCDECNIPGYLIVFNKTGALHYADLNDMQLIHYTRVLAQTQRAIQQATHAERVYTCSFSELNPTLHVHLLPRTTHLAKMYREHHDLKADASLDGDLLFAWARRYYQQQLLVTADELIACHQAIHRNLLKSLSQ